MGYLVGHVSETLLFGTGGSLKDCISRYWDLSRTNGDVLEREGCQMVC